MLQDIKFYKNNNTALTVFNLYWNNWSAYYLRSKYEDIPESKKNVENINEEL